MDIKIGSNAFRNTNGILVIQGKEQVVLELRPDTLQMLLTMDFYDAESRHIAHLRRNTWGFNEDDRFAIAASPENPSLFTPAPWMKVWVPATEETIFEIQLSQKDVVTVSNGRFYTHRGQLVEISSHYCRIAGGTTKFGDVADLRGGAVTID